MKSHFHLVLVVFTLFCFGCEKDDSTDSVASFNRELMLADLHENVISPSFEDLTTQSLNLQLTLVEMEGDLTLESLQAARGQWTKTAVAWNECALFNIGPIRNSYVYQKVHSWPANNTFIQAYLNGSEALDVDFISTIGSSSKGLSALEWLLFQGENLEASYDSLTLPNTAPRKLTYLKSVAQDLHLNTLEVKELWTEYTYGEVFVSATQNGISGSINLLGNEMISLIEKVVNTKVGKPMGKDSPSGDVRTDLLEAYYSGASLDLISANVDALDNVLFGSPSSNNSLSDYINFVEGSVGLSTQLTNSIVDCKIALSSVNDNMNDPVILQSQELEAAYEELRELLVLIKVDMSSQLSLVLTINDNDGD